MFETETKIVIGREYIVSPEGKIGKRVIRLKNKDYNEWRNMRAQELRREHKFVIWLMVIAVIGIAAGILTTRGLLFQFSVIVLVIAVYICLSVRWIYRCIVRSNERKRSILAFYETFQNVPPQEVGLIDQSKDPNITFVVLPASEYD